MRNISIWSATALAVSMLASPAGAQVGGVPPIDALHDLLTIIEGEVAGTPNHRFYAPSLTPDIVRQQSTLVQSAQARGFPVSAAYIGLDKPGNVNGYAFRVQYANETLVWRVYYNASKQIEGIWFDRTAQTPTGQSPRGKYAIICGAFPGVKGC